MMRSQSNHNLRRLFLVFTILILIAYFLAFWQSWRGTLEDTHNSLTHINSAQVQGVYATMKTHELVLKGLGSELLVLGALENPEKGRNLINRIKSIDAGMVGFGLARADGQLLLVSGVKPGVTLPNLLNTPEAKEGFAQAIKSEHIQIGRPYLMQSLGQWVSPIRVPLHDKSGKVVAVMAAGYSLEASNTGWGKIHFAEHVHAALLRDDGYLQFYFPLPDWPLQEIFGTKVMDETLRQVNNLPAKSGFTSMFLPRLGSTYYVAYQRIDEFGLLSAAFIPRSVVIELWLKRMIGPTALLLLYLAGGWWVYRRISAQQEASEKEVLQLSAWQQAVLDSANYSIISTDTNGVIVGFNAAATRMFGYSPEEMIGKQTPAILHDAEEVVLRAKTLSAELGKTIEPGFDVFVSHARKYGVEEREWTHIRKDGSRFPVRLSISAIQDVQGNISGFLGVASDLTESQLAKNNLQESEARYKYLAMHDPLTGLINRYALHEQIGNSIKINQAGSAVLMLIDLDRFKEINDTLGHHIGDKILQKIGPLLHTVLSDYSALVCRLGGDEFTVYIENLDNVDAIRIISEQLRNAIRHPFEIDSIRLEIDSSIGIALYPQHGADSHALLRSADVAMYQAKSRGGGSAFYDQESDQHSPDRLAIMAELGIAIREHQLCLHYQPKFDLLAQRITGFEALVRWQHPRMGMLYPDSFIPLAEVSDVIHALTETVITMAAAQQRKWQAAGLDFSVAINLSARNLLDDRCLEQLQSIFLQGGVDPGKFELEITESALMQDPERAVSRLEKISGLGVKLSIDDFGTGYSSLSYLRRLPIHTLKIDKIFVMEMTKNSQDEQIVRSTIDLAHSLNLKVIAEGVEDEETLALLRQTGCDAIQGYHIARPMAWDQISQFLKLSPSA